ncbi:a1-alpha2 repression [Allomyces arbusculus]|nr:a1-alpha2 repression [Allomyces arbusculus]
MDPLQSMDMDQETAQHLFEKGAKVVILGLPEQSEFGVDFASWETGPRFKGLKFVPPGLHFMHYRPPAMTSRLRNEGVASASASAPDFRTGFFHWFAESEILVCEWDTKNEDLKFDLELNQDQVQRIKLNIREFDPFLGTYPIKDGWAKWQRQSKNITATQLDLILPRKPGTTIHPLTAMAESNLSDADLKAAEARRTTQGGASAAPMDVDQPVLAKSAVAAVTTQTPKIHFTDFDLKRSWDPSGSSSASEITRYSMDKSWLLLSVMKRPNVDLLGELQLAFLCLLVGQNFEGFEQWKKLMHLICRSVEAIDQIPEFFVKFMAVLRDQLAECPSDFFVDVMSQDNFLITLLQELVANIADSSANATHPRLERAVNRLRGFVQKRFEVELVDPFDDEYLDEEDRPVVVEL